MKTRSVFTIILALCAISPVQAQRDSIRLDEVVVTGTRARVSRDNLPSTISVVNRQEIEESGESALLSALTGQVPGLFITERGVLGFGVGSSGAGTITLRGVGGGTELLVLIDGHPQYMGVMGHHLPDAYVASNVERVEIIRGPASLLYGSNAMGGVINIITRGATREGWSEGASLAAGSYNTREIRGHGAGKAGRREIFFSLDHNHTDGHRDDKSARFDLANGYVKLSYRLSEHFRAWGDLNIAAYETKNPGTKTDPILDNVADILRGVASVTLESRFDKSHGAFTFFYNFGDHEIDDGYYPASPTPSSFLFRSRDHNYGFQLYQSVQPFRGTTISAGIDFKNFGGRAWDDFKNPAMPDNVNVDTSLYELAGYLVVQQTLFDKWTLNAGARVENNECFGVEWIPQAGVAYRPFRDGVFKASIAKGFRSPNIRDLFYKAGWAGANPDLQPESMMNYELSAGQSFRGGDLAVEVTAFISRGKNLIVKTGPPFESKNTGRFKHRGVELSARWDVLKNLRVQGNYSYLYMEEPVLYAPARQFNLSATYRAGKWRLSTGYQHASGLHNGAAGEESFGLWDARVAYHPAGWLGLFAKGDNLAGTRYQIIAGYPMPRATVTGGVNVTF
ncbi:MAG: TonB-dependent receptor [Odoribacteraceae bacterium]|jgi:iron complex outermembrane receptor protein|nr:TonB-dependent receptor [Odoribacteraceae bacterium]